MQKEKFRLKSLYNLFMDAINRQVFLYDYRPSCVTVWVYNHSPYGWMRSKRIAHIFMFGLKG